MGFTYSELPKIPFEGELLTLKEDLEHHYPLTDSEHRGPRWGRVFLLLPWPPFWYKPPDSPFKPDPSLHPCAAWRECQVTSSSQDVNMTPLWAKECFGRKGWTKSLQICMYGWLAQDTDPAVWPGQKSELVNHCLWLSGLVTVQLHVNWVLNP